MLSSGPSLQMTDRLCSVLRPVWQLPLMRMPSNQAVVILMYHGIPEDGGGRFIDSEILDQHIRFLKRHFELVGPNELRENRRARKRIRVLLTFDDGFRNNAEIAAPILDKHSAPAVFFISSRHSVSGKYLWFSYLSALERHFPSRRFSFRGAFFNMGANERHSSIRELRKQLLALTPHPGAMYQAIAQELPVVADFVSPERWAAEYEGMTSLQVAELAKNPLFSIGVHTVDHPFLTKCEPDEALRQITDNKTWLERVSNRHCDSIAYPGGDCNQDIIEQCRNLGFCLGHSIIPTSKRNIFELPRIGIYAQSLDVLGFKVRWGNLIRSLRLRVG
jgi:peptidoglycan/xylan/chitin deacetylase (PgdA/CDA1 family)